MKMLIVKSVFILFGIGLMIFSFYAHVYMQKKIAKEALREVLQEEAGK